MPRIFAATLADNRQQTWDALFRALDLCLTTKSLDQITLAEIAAKAGMARNTIYNYAADKTALMAAAMDQYAKPLIADLEVIATAADPAPLRIKAMIARILDAVAHGEPRAILRHTVEGIGFSPEALPDALARIRLLFERVTRDGHDAGAFGAHDPLTWDLLAGVMHAAALHLGRHPDDYPAICGETVRIVLAALERQD